MRVWRITKKAYASVSFSGEGGFLAPGRWHHRGQRIVYTSQNLSLATLETWVHIAPVGPLPDHVQIWADIPDDIPVRTFFPHELPSDWKNTGCYVPGLQDLGKAWLTSQETAVARIPSVFSTSEFNFLLNPEHPHFARIIPGEPQPFEFDPRMWKSKN